MNSLIKEMYGIYTECLNQIFKISISDYIRSLLYHKIGGLYRIGSGFFSL